jgi:hypothetical protein
MTSLTAELRVETNASRWWLAIEPAAKDLESPSKVLRLTLEPGVRSALVYYVQGTPGKTISMVLTCNGKELVKVERKIGANKFAYGHKAFDP